MFRGNWFNAILLLSTLILPFNNCTGDFRALQQYDSVISNTDTSADNSSNTDNSSSSDNNSNTGSSSQPPSKINLSIEGQSAKQGFEIQFNFKLAEAKTKLVTIEYETQDGTATKNDYIGAKGQLSLMPGETSAKIQVKTNDQIVNFESKSLSLKVSATMEGAKESYVAEAMIQPNKILIMSKTISLGQYHACAVTPQRTVKCRGRNSEGQLGNGTTTGTMGSAVDVVGLTNVVSLDTTNTISCAVVNDGSVKCWGEYFGTTPKDVGVTGAIQVAARRAQSWALRSDGKVLAFSADQAPREVPGLANVKYIDSSVFYICALTQDGAVHCDLENDQPVNDMRAFAVGAGSACGITLQNTVKCWGQNIFGEIGPNFSSEYSPPTEIEGVSNVKSIVAGEYHYCAVIGDGSVKCWGSNQFNTLGNNGAPSYPIVPVIGLSGAQAAISGSIATCAVTADEKFMCWGLSAYGITGSSTATPAQLFGY